MERQKRQTLLRCRPCYEYDGCQSKNLHRLTHCSCGSLHPPIRKVVDKQRSISYDKRKISESSLRTCVSRGLHCADVVRSRTQTFYVAYLTSVTHPLGSLPTLTVTVGAVHSMHKSFGSTTTKRFTTSGLFSRT